MRGWPNRRLGHQVTSDGSTVRFWHEPELRMRQWDHEMLERYRKAVEAAGIAVKAPPETGYVTAMIGPPGAKSPEGDTIEPG